MKSDVRMPIISVFAKPWISGLPYWNITTPAMNVVICPSKMLQNARRKP